MLPKYINLDFKVLEIFHIPSSFRFTLPKSVLPSDHWFFKTIKLSKLISLTKVTYIVYLLSNYFRFHLDDPSSILQNISIYNTLLSHFISNHQSLLTHQLFRLLVLEATLPNFFSPYSILITYLQFFFILSLQKKKNEEKEVYDLPFNSPIWSTTDVYSKWTFKIFILNEILTLVFLFVPSYILPLYHTRRDLY